MKIKLSLLLLIVISVLGLIKIALKAKAGKTKTVFEYNGFYHIAADHGARVLYSKDVKQRNILSFTIKEDKTTIITY